MAPSGAGLAMWAVALALPPSSAIRDAYDTGSALALWQDASQNGTRSPSGTCCCRGPFNNWCILIRHPEEPATEKPRSCPTDLGYRPASYWGFADEPPHWPNKCEIGFPGEIQARRKIVVRAHWVSSGWSCANALGIEGDVLQDASSLQHQGASFVDYQDPPLADAAMERAEKFGGPILEMVRQRMRDARAEQDGRPTTTAIPETKKKEELKARLTTDEIMVEYVKMAGGDDKFVAEAAISAIAGIAWPTFEEYTEKQRAMIETAPQHLKNKLSKDKERARDACTTLTNLALRDQAEGKIGGLAEQYVETLPGVKYTAGGQVTVPYNTPPPDVESKTCFDDAKPLSALAQTRKYSPDFVVMIGDILRPGRGKRGQDKGQGFAGYREVRGDGNCFWRALSIGMMEQFVVAKSKHRARWLREFVLQLQRIKFGDDERAESKHRDGTTVGFEKKQHELLVKFFESYQENPDRDMHNIYAVIADESSGIEIAMIKAMKKIVAEHILENADLHGHLGGGVTYAEIALLGMLIKDREGSIDSFVNEIVMPMEQEAEEPAPQAASVVFSLVLRVLTVYRDTVDYDVSPYSDQRRKDVVESMMPVDVLLKPGHYDIVYQWGRWCNLFPKKCPEGHEEELEEEQEEEEAKGDPEEQLPGSPTTKEEEVNKQGTLPEGTRDPHSRVEPVRGKKEDPLVFSSFMVSAMDTAACNFPGLNVHPIPHIADAGMDPSSTPLPFKEQQDRLTRFATAERLGRFIFDVAPEEHRDRTSDTKSDYGKLVHILPNVLQEYIKDDDSEEISVVIVSHSKYVHDNLKVWVQNYELEVGEGDYAMWNGRLEPVGKSQPLFSTAYYPGRPQRLCDNDIAMCRDQDGAFEPRGWLRKDQKWCKEKTQLKTGEWAEDSPTFSTVMRDVEHEETYTRCPSPFAVKLDLEEKESDTGYVPWVSEALNEARRQARVHGERWRKKALYAKQDKATAEARKALGSPTEEESEKRAAVRLLRAALRLCGRVGLEDGMDEEWYYSEDIEEARKKLNRLERELNLEADSELSAIPRPRTLTASLAPSLAASWRGRWAPGATAPISRDTLQEQLSKPGVLVIRVAKRDDRARGWVGPLGVVLGSVRVRDVDTVVMYISDILVEGAIPDYNRKKDKENLLKGDKTEGKVLVSTLITAVNGYTGLRAIYELEQKQDLTMVLTYSIEGAKEFLEGVAQLESQNSRGRLRSTAIVGQRPRRRSWRRSRRSRSSSSGEGDSDSEEDVLSTGQRSHSLPVGVKPPSLEARTRSQSVKEWHVDDITAKLASGVIVEAKEEIKGQDDSFGSVTIPRGSQGSIDQAWSPSTKSTHVKWRGRRHGQGVGMTLWRRDLPKIKVAASQRTRTTGQAWSWTSTEALKAGAKSITVSSAGSVKKGDKLVISGDGNSEMVVVASVSGGKITFESALSSSYAAGWYVCYYSAFHGLKVMANKKISYDTPRYTVHKFDYGEIIQDNDEGDMHISWQNHEGPGRQNLWLKRSEWKKKLSRGDLVYVKEMLPNGSPPPGMEMYEKLDKAMQTSNVEEISRAIVEAMHTLGTTSSAVRNTQDQLHQLLVNTERRSEAEAVAKLCTAIRWPNIKGASQAIKEAMGALGLDNALVKYAQEQQQSGLQAAGVTQEARASSLEVRHASVTVHRSVAGTSQVVEDPTGRQRADHEE